MAQLILCDVSTGVPWSYLILRQFRGKVFDSLHSLSYPSIRGTHQYLVTACSVWPGINADVCLWTRTSLQCQKSVIHRHTITPPGNFWTPDTGFDNTYRYYGSFTTFKKVELFVNLYRLLTGQCVKRWPLYTLAWGFSIHQYHSRISLTNIFDWLDLQIWDSFNCYKSNLRKHSMESSLSPHYGTI